MFTEKSRNGVGISAVGMSLTGRSPSCLPWCGLQRPLDLRLRPCCVPRSAPEGFNFISYEPTRLPCHFCSLVRCQKLASFRKVFQGRISTVGQSATCCAPCRGVVSVSMLINELDINQCPDYEAYSEFNAFQDTHKCDRRSSRVSTRNSRLERHSPGIGAFDRN